MRQPAADAHGTSGAADLVSIDTPYPVPACSPITSDCACSTRAAAIIALYSGNVFVYADILPNIVCVWAMQC